MKGLFGVAVCIILIFSSAAYGQYGRFKLDYTNTEFNLDSQLIYRTVGQLKNFDFTGGGARAAGMGKAFIGVSDDITAGSWNPAGLIIHQKPMMALSAGSMSPRGQVNPGTNSTDLKGSFSKLSYIGFVAPIRIRGHQFVGSASYGMLTEEYDQSGFTTRFYIPAATGPGSFEILQGVFKRTVTTHNTPYIVNLGFGTRIYRAVSFGLSVNVYAGGSVMNRSNMYTLENFPEFSTGSFQRSTMVGVQDVIDTVKYSGVNFAIGLKHSGEKLSAGLVVKTPFTLSAGYATTIFDRAAFAGMTLRDGTDTIYRDNNLYKISVPLIAGGGIGYKASEKLLLALDAELRMFAGNKIQDRQSVKIKPGGSTEDSFTVSNPDYRNSFVLRAGAEYTWETGNSLFPKIPLRAGFSFVPTAAPSVTEAYANRILDSVTYDFLGQPTKDTVFHYSLETTSSKAVTMYSLSAGMGLKWSQIRLDFAYIFSTLSRSQIIGISPVSDVNRRHQAIISEGKNRNHSFMMTFTGYF